MAEMSSAVWKRTPTTAEALFGVMLPYQPPRNPVAAFFWRKRVIVETSTGTVGLDVWEKVLVGACSFTPASLLSDMRESNSRSFCLRCRRSPLVYILLADLLHVTWCSIHARVAVSVFFLMLTYVCTGIIKYLPQYLMLLQRQVLYHLCDNGRESIGPVIQEWAAQNASRDL